MRDTEGLADDIFPREVHNKCRRIYEQYCHVTCMHRIKKKPGQRVRSDKTEIMAVSRTCITGSPDLHTLIDFDAAIVIIVQLLVDVPQCLEAEAISFVHARWDNGQAWICKKRGKISRQDVLQQQKTTGSWAFILLPIFKADTLIYH